MVKEIKRHIFETKDEWAAIRKDLFTASRISEIIPNGRVLMTKEELEEYKKANPKSQAKYREDETVLGDGAISYILEIIQGLEGAPKETYYSSAMDWGNTTEPEAAIRYCEMYGYDLQDDDVIYTSEGGVVFFVGDNLLGCTPDLILRDRLCQIKCPDSSTHLYYKLHVNEENFKQELPNYYAQIQQEMMLTERDVCDFFSFDPRFTRKSLQTHKVEVKADKEFQALIYRKALICEAKKKEYINQINNL
jgi:hypothetical protein